MTAPSDAEMLLMEVTGVGVVPARSLLEAFGGDVSAAVAGYFENPQQFVASEPACFDDRSCDGRVPRAPSLSMVQASPSGDVRYKPESCKRGASLKILVHLAYMASTIEIDSLHADDTVLTLKMLIADATKVPVVVQNLVFRGHCLLDSKMTLKAAGFTAKSEVAALFADRNERGSVKVITTTTDGKSTPLFELQEGEWNASTSLRDVRARALESMGFPKGSWILVHNALRVDDASTFAQNGIRKGSVIAVLDEKNRADISKR